MTLQQYIENIKLLLTGGVLQLEIPDESLAQIVNLSLVEIRRFIDTAEIITVPFSPCIDLTDFKCSSISNIYRTDGFNGTGENMSDPMYAQQWMIYSSGGSMYNLQNYLLNYMAYNTFSQIRNTTSTDLNYKLDKKNNKLYINISYNVPKMITIEYVPIYDKVEEITSEYWIDILQRLALAKTKIVLGRIRSKYKQANAQWSLDGETLLAEGNEEYNTLMEYLNTNSTIFYPVD